MQLLKPITLISAVLLFTSETIAENEEIPFKIRFSWNVVNFTWPSSEEYQLAINSKKYIPENNALAGLKFYKNTMYLALPRVRPGTPVTLAKVTILPDLDTKNVLLTPYPSWAKNVQDDCATLQNVQSMEIDTNGIIWVLDGTRINSLTSCPPKLILLDLNDNGKVVHTFLFKNEICLHSGGFLNDIVLDDSDGGYAYITDNSAVDPGLIVYSRQKDDAWKVRDKSMFAEIEATNYKVDDLTIKILAGVDGVALSPKSKNNNARKLFYCALSGFNLYAISTKILKDAEACRQNDWRKEIELIGKKSSSSDGMIIDNAGNLYYGLLSSSGIGKWNINTPFEEETSLYNTKEFLWPDSFAIDKRNNLHILTNGIPKYFNQDYPLELTEDIKFRIWSAPINNKNYMHFQD